MATAYKMKLKPGVTFFGGGKGIVIWNVVPAKPNAKSELEPPAEKKRKR